MDDYLLLSTNKDSLAHFVSHLHFGLTSRGSRINLDKTKVNFDLRLDVGADQVQLPVMSGNTLAWCGLIINLNDLSVSPDISRMMGRSLHQNISVSSSFNGQSLRRSIKSLIRMKIHAIILDPRISSMDCIIQSLFSMFCLAGWRVREYIHRVFYLSKNPMNLHFIEQCLVDGIYFGARLVRSRLRVSYQRSREIDRNIDAMVEGDIVSSPFLMKKDTKYLFSFQIVS